MKAPAIVIVVEGGLVQNVLSTAPVEFAVIDYDVEGTSDDELLHVPQAPLDSGKVAPAIYWGDMAEISEEWVGAVYDAVADFNDHPAPLPAETPPDTPCLDDSFHRHEMDI